jgi:putative FmdB family regulatory protein
VPTYAFTCAGCGPFELLRRMSEASAPASCPQCGGDARRRFTPPGVARLSTPVRSALDRELKSGHEPDVVARKEGRPMPHLHDHGHHGHHHAPPWAMSH